MTDKAIGSVDHYYDKIGVAVLKLTAGLKVNDQLKFVKGDQEFTQAVESMQMEKKTISQAKRGDSVGLKVDQSVKPGTKVFIIS